MESTELIVIEKINAIELFTGDKVDPLLEEITKKAKEFVPDISTDAGRKEIASFAYKVARTKTTLDDLGKNLVARWKEDAKRVDSVRKHIRDYLDDLKDEVRKPLTEFEAAEQKRIEEEARKAMLAEAESEAYAEHSLFLRQKEIERKEAEFSKMEADRLAKEREEAEKEASRLAEIERKKAVEKAINEAAERAGIEAERKAAERTKALQAAIEKAERDKREAAEKAEREKIAAIEAEKEKARLEAKKLEDERARKEKAEAARIEGERIEAEKKAANLNHRKKINREALSCLETVLKSSFDSGHDFEETAKAIVTAIAFGKITHVTIRY
jgi:hypothetical protein